MFNLKKLVKGAYDDVNVFDGGKSHNNPTAAPRPASTARPNIVQRAASSVAHVPTAVDHFATRSAFGRGAQAVGLGALQTGVEGLQGVAGLGDAVNHKLGLYQGISPATKALTNTAKNIDITAQKEHSNPLL